MGEASVGGFHEVLRRAAAGDSAAAQTLLDQYTPAIEKAIRRRHSSMLRRMYDTVDLRQSVMLDVLRDLPRFEDRGEPAFRRWIIIKAISKIQTKYRRHLFARGGRRETTLHLGDGFLTDPEEEGPVSATLRDEERAEMSTLLGHLEGNQRHVVELRNAESLTFPEIAAWMNLPSADAARKLYARAILKLRSVRTRTSRTLSRRSSESRSREGNSPPKS